MIIKLLLWLYLLPLAINCIVIYGWQNDLNKRLDNDWTGIDASIAKWFFSWLPIIPILNLWTVAILIFTVFDVIQRQFTIRIKWWTRKR